MVSVLVLTIVYARRDGVDSIAVYVRKHFQLKRAPMKKLSNHSVFSSCVLTNMLK
jgi:hypothetical protein